MAPKQTTAKQTQAIVNQIITLLDSLDYKALAALYSLHYDRYRAWGSKSEDLNALEPRAISIAEMNAAALQAEQVRIINSCKKHIKAARDKSP